MLIFLTLKFQRLRSNVNKLFSNLSDLTNLIQNSSDGFNKNATIHSSRKKDENTINTPQINNLESFYKEYTDFRNKTDEELKNINNKLKSKSKLPLDSERNGRELNDLNLQNSGLNTDAIKPIDISILNNPNNPPNQQFIISLITQLQENDKLVLQNLTHKVNRDEIEKIQRTDGNEIRRLYLKIVN
jgi:hypothetical protein